MHDSHKLKTGYSTGACAAAAAKAAFFKKSPGEKINVWFPDNNYHDFLITSCEIRKNGTVTASVIKDAGDDPDITHNARIYATISPLDISEDLCEIRKAHDFLSGTIKNHVQPGTATLQRKNISCKSIASFVGEHDYELECGKAWVILRGGEGIGYSTRIGPDVPVGKWAINPIPRQMIIKNLQEAGCGSNPGVWLVDISIENGEKLAEKTLNPTIGIVGGLSVLGTTGIVEPKSHAAYIETIRILLKGIAEDKNAHSITAVFCTGARTQKAVAKDYDKLPEHAFIGFGDFIAESMKMAEEFKCDKVIVACMPGKLLKYASGFENTHAHKVKLDITALEAALKFCKISDEICKKVLSSLTIREALECLSDNNAKSVLNFVGKQALKNIRQWCPDTTCEIRTYNYDAKLLGNWKYVKG